MYEHRISCAAGGHFRLGLMNAWTPWVAWNATIAELKSALRGRVYAPVPGLHPSPRIEIASDDEYVCSNVSTQVRITFFDPPTGPGFQTSRADLDPMSIDLTGDYVLGIEGLYGSPTIQASLSVSEVRRGTAQPLGLDSRGENAGAAFVFKRVPVDATIYARVRGSRKRDFPM